MSRSARRLENWRVRFSRPRARRSRWRSRIRDIPAKSPRRRRLTKGLNFRSSSCPRRKRASCCCRAWVIERSFGWLNRFRRLARDYERLPRNSGWLALRRLLRAYACALCTPLAKVPNTL
ncbi:transposase [Paraburkholderia sp. BR14264]|uniref:transposase n=1 Tax=Paraburkholderia sp. BR14264 TaxID=3237001 RepID=UPI0039783DC0